MAFSQPIHLIQKWLWLIDMLLTNQNTEIVACILLTYKLALMLPHS